MASNAMIRYRMSFAVALLLIAASATAAPLNPTSDYLGMPPPGPSPQVFARGIISTDDLEHSAPAFTPDGNEVFWSTNHPLASDKKDDLFLTAAMRRENGVWSAPYRASFDGMVVLSADGQHVYFSPRGPDTDIWVSKREGAGWSKPKCLNFLSRWPELKHAWVESISRNQTIYFIGRALGPLNDYGIYRAEFVNGEYAKPELLPRSINLPPFLNWTPFIAPDESYLLFSSNRRDPDRDAGDLYISLRNADGSWTDPASLGAPVNTNVQERFPLVSWDGKYLFFTRWTPDHSQDVFWVNTASVPALRSAIKHSQRAK